MRAMILAAGFGTRLGDLTREIPKGMLDVGGMPLLERVVRNLARNDIREIAINLHFQPDVIRGHFGDGSRLGVTLAWSMESELLGTAGGVHRMADFLREGDAFLVHYGDIVTDQDFKAMEAFHREKRALATLLLHERARSNSIVNLDEDGRVTGFLERPTEAERQEARLGLVNSGVCICSPELLDAIPGKSPCDLPRDVFTPLVSSGRLFGFPLSGYRCAVDSPQRLEEARAAVAEGRCRS